jgi:hypothetical protein
MIIINLIVCALMTVQERGFHRPVNVDVGYMPIQVTGSIGEDREIGKLISG